MKRQSRPQDRGDHDLLVGHHDFGFAQRRFDRPGLILERFADLVGHNLACPFQVPAEAHAVALHRHVAHLCDKAVEDRVLPVQYRYHLFCHCSQNCVFVLLARVPAGD